MNRITLRLDSLESLMCATMPTTTKLHNLFGKYNRRLGKMHKFYLNGSRLDGTLTPQEYNMHDNVIVDVLVCRQYGAFA